MTGAVANAKPTAVVVDDEPQLRAFLRRQLAECWPELVIAGEARDGGEALQVIEQTRPDIVFLDIQMPGLSGFEVAGRMAAGPRVVFVTAFDQYAIDAFENAAVDYLLKPVGIRRLEKTVARLKTQLRSEPVDIARLAEKLAGELRSRPAHLQWLQALEPGGMVMVPVADVDYFQSADKYTLVFTHEREWTIRMSLKELETSLDPEHFWRVHRNAIVRVAAIARATHGFRGNYTLQIHGHKQTISVGRGYAHRFKPS